MFCRLQADLIPTGISSVGREKRPRNRYSSFTQDGPSSCKLSSPERSIMRLLSLLQIKLRFPLFSGLTLNLPRCLHLDDRNIVIVEQSGSPAQTPCSGVLSRGFAIREVRRFLNQ